MALREHEITLPDAQEGVTLDQVLTDLPWQGQFTPGVGVDAITGKASGTALQPFKLLPFQTQTSEDRYRFVKDESDYSQEIKATASGKYNIEGVDVSLSTEYLTQIKYSQVFVTLVAEWTTEGLGYDEPEPGSLKLTEAAAALIKEPEKFRNAFGDYFVVGGRGGSRFVGTYTCKASSASSLDSFMATLGGSAPNVFTAEGSTKFEQAASASKISVECDIFMWGHSGTPPNFPKTPEGIMEALDWFKKNHSPAYVQAKLEHYSVLDPTYPRTIPVANDAFVELSVLYKTLWDVRALYRSCPRKYQDELSSRYTSLDASVIAYAGELAVNGSKRQELFQKAEELKADLDKVFQRMAFYYKVDGRRGTEPGKDSEVWSGWGNSWLFGYSSYSESDAMKINTDKRSYSDKGHVGYRESNLEWSDPNSIIVGWEVFNNWQSDNNGGWWKSVDQILLTDTLKIHVKSDYDRGCDWTVFVYYVNAGDYNFSS